MKKIVLWLLVIICLVAVMIGIAFYIWLQSMLPAKEERISHRNEMIIAMIDEQLKDVNLDEVKLKKEFIEQKTVLEIKSALKEKYISYEELVAYYLLNIKEKDQSEEGNNAVSEVSPTAIEEARKLDQLGLFDETKPLLGIPVLVKENINTNNMPTSAGSFALQDFIPTENAFVVDQLIENGAIILGKTNLSEMSHYMSHKNPSGYSSKKGQTTNPFRPLVLSPSGSSSGSAVAMATDLSTVSLGTETSGSIVSPASVNSVVGYKPTRGKIDGSGVIPITYSLDTVGTITKTVEDTLLTYIASTDQNIELQLDREAIRGKKIGMIKSDSQFDSALEKTLQELGTEVVLLDVDVSKIDLLFILKNDFEKDLNHYLQSNHAPVESLSELVAFNREDETVRMHYGQNYLEEALSPERDDEKVLSMIKLAQTILNQTMDENHLDVMVAKNNNYAILAAGAGAPEVSVPFGMIDDAPVGATFFGYIGDDARVLQIAYSFEQLTKLRLIPVRK